MNYPLLILLIILFIVIFFFSYTIYNSRKKVPIQKSILSAVQISSVNDIYGVYIPSNSYSLYNNFKLPEGIIIENNLIIKYISNIYSEYLYNMNVLTPDDFYNGKQLNLQLSNGDVFSIKYNDNKIICTKSFNGNYFETIFEKLDNTQIHQLPYGMYGDNTLEYGDRISIYLDKKTDLIIMKNLQDNNEYIIGDVDEYLQELKNGDIIPINPKYKIQYKNGSIINHIDNTIKYFIY